VINNEKLLNKTILEIDFLKKTLMKSNISYKH